MIDRALAAGKIDISFESPGVVYCLKVCYVHIFFLKPPSFLLLLKDHRNERRSCLLKINTFWQQHLGKCLYKGKEKCQKKMQTAPLMIYWYKGLEPAKHSQLQQCSYWFIVQCKLSTCTDRTLIHLRYYCCQGFLPIWNNLMFCIGIKTPCFPGLDFLV
jgi:hypothetical protein